MLNPFRIVNFIEICSSPVKERVCRRGRSAMKQHVGQGLTDFTDWINNSYFDFSIILFQSASIDYFKIQLLNSPYKVLISDHG